MMKHLKFRTFCYMESRLMLNYVIFEKKPVNSIIMQEWFNYSTPILNLVILFYFATNFVVPILVELCLWV